MGVIVVFGFNEYINKSWIDVLEMIDDIREKYDYVTALRSFDCNYPTLKTIFTGFLRGKPIDNRNTYVNVNDFVELILENDVKDLAEEIIYELDSIIKNNEVRAFDHWFGHTRKALYILYRITKMKIVEYLIELADAIYEYVFELSPKFSAIYSYLNGIVRELRKELL